MTQLSASHLTVESTATLRQSLSSRQVFLLCVLACAGIALLDVRTHLNLSIVYSLLVVIAARRASKSTLWQFAMLLVTLTFGGYILKCLYLLHWNWNQILGANNLINRTLAAMSIVSLTAICQLWNRVRRRVEGSRPLYRGRDEDRQDFDQIARSLERMAAFIMCAFLTVCIAAADLITPGQFNLPILYAVPLVLCYALGSRRMLWLVLPWLLLFTAIGYFVGPAPSISNDLIHFVAANRLIAGIALIAIAGLLHLMMDRPLHDLS